VDQQIGGFESGAEELGRGVAAPRPGQSSTQVSRNKVVFLGDVRVHTSVSVENGCWHGLGARPLTWSALVAARSGRRSATTKPESEEGIIGQKNGSKEETAW